MRACIDKLLLARRSCTQLNLPMTNSDALPTKTAHIVHHFDVELSNLREKVHRLGEETLDLWGLNHQALIDGNLKLASDVLAKLGPSTRMQLDIEHDGLLILAKEQPVASDLRFVVSMIKLSYELRNILQVAHEMARLILALYVPRHGATSVNLIADIANIDLSIYRMIAGLIEALHTLNVQAINQSYETGNSIDSSVQTGISRLIDYIQANPNQISPCLMLLQMLKALESGNRNCKNFAEYGAYMIDGIELKNHSPT